MKRTGNRLFLCLLALCLGVSGILLVEARSTRVLGLPTKVMPLGDSITHGYNVPGGYRITLWEHVLEDDLLVDFVGSQANGPSSLGDRDHEGHSGWRIDQLDANIDAWLSRYQPEIILLMIGTNDMIHDYNPSSAPSRLSALIEKIVAHDPSTRLIVASLPPLSDPASNQRVLSYNAALPELIRQKAAEGKRVIYIDMYPKLALSDLADGIHPSKAGYTKLANAWYEALRDYLRLPVPLPSGRKVYLPSIIHDHGVQPAERPYLAIADER